LHQELLDVKTVAVARTAVLVLLLASGSTLVTAGCSAPSPAPRPQVDPEAVKAEAASLLESLEKSFYSHWGSVESTSEYRRLREDHLPILRQIADSNGEHALMALRVLAKRAPGERFTPAAKAIIYWTVFQRDDRFNRWGLISKAGFVPGVYGHELLALGSAAAPYLQRSLRDGRRAPVVGVEEERTGRINVDRVCDYAWIFLATIFDRPLAYHADPRLRDSQIRDLDIWLDRRR
jgi:hypothetical protein